VIIYGSEEFASHGPELPPVSPARPQVSHYGEYNNSHHFGHAEPYVRHGHDHLLGHSHWIMGADGRAWQTGCGCGV